MALVGYYSMMQDAGTDAMADDIKLSGNELVLLDGTNWDMLAKLDTLYVWNGDNDSYAKAFLEQIPKIADAIKSGMNMLVFDRAIGNANPSEILPGTDLQAKRFLSDNADLTDIGEKYLGAGPAPNVNDDTIDGGNYTTHGFVTTDSLPKNATVLMTPIDGNTIEAVGFEYHFGAGMVQYYGIPMDYYNDFTEDFSNPWQNLAVNALSHSAVCLAMGTMIATAQGMRVVESLQAGDLVQTLDHGLQPLRWLVAGEATDEMVEVAAGVLGNLAPLFLTRQHRILVASCLVELAYGADAVLVPAAALVEVGLAKAAAGAVVFNLLFDGHEIICAGQGALVESLWLGRQSQRAIGRAGRLAAHQSDVMQAARPVLMQSEAVGLLIWHREAGVSITDPLIAPAVQIAA